MIAIFLAAENPKQKRKIGIFTHPTLNQSIDFPVPSWSTLVCCCLPISKPRPLSVRHRLHHCPILEFPYSLCVPSRKARFTEYHVVERQSRSMVEEPEDTYRACTVQFGDEIIRVDGDKVAWWQLVVDWIPQTKPVHVTRIVGKLNKNNGNVSVGEFSKPIVSSVMKYFFNACYFKKEKHIDYQHVALRKKGS